MMLDMITPPARMPRIPLQSFQPHIDRSPNKWTISMIPIKSQYSPNPRTDDTAVMTGLAKKRSPRRIAKMPSTSGYHHREGLVGATATALMSPSPSGSSFLITDHGSPAA